MAEILGGVMVMAVFVLFVIWKSKGKPKRTMTTQDYYKEEWWAAQSKEPVITSADANRGDDD
jgi:hypothetical protein